MWTVNKSTCEDEMKMACVLRCHLYFSCFTQPVHYCCCCLTFTLVDTLDKYRIDIFEVQLSKSCKDASRDTSSIWAQSNLQ